MSVSVPVSAPHAQTPAELAAALQTDLTAGLASAEVSRRLEKYGPNQLSEAREEPWWKLLLQQFQQLMVGLLLAAAVLSGWLGDWTDAAAISAIVILNGLLGFFQEARAARSLAALRQLSAPNSKVIRGGHLQSVPASEVVPGDLLQVEAGDQISADARLITAFSLVVQEATLTGESTPVEKQAHAVLARETLVGDRRNMIHRGTAVSAGKATAIVTGTGMSTELGQIASLLASAPAEQTPLQKQLTQLGRLLLVLCLTLVGVIFVLQLARGGAFVDTFLLAISLAVASVPEGLPAVVTITLALGMHRLARRQALVRNLPSTETLGSVTVICTDKTGTLTRNEMTVRELYIGEAWYETTASAELVPAEARRRDTAAVTSADRQDLLWALTIGAVCNNAELEQGDVQSPPRAVGDPTEVALLMAAHRHGYDAQVHHPGEVTHENPFDSDRKAMSVVVRRRQTGNTLMFLKGAPESVLEWCTDEFRAGKTVPLSPERRREILRVNGEMASRALRVLALTFREQPTAPGSEDHEREMAFVGLVGMMDPPRPDVPAAVERCRTAGIRPVMITGDHPATARAIARELGIAADDQQVVTGTELNSWSESELNQRIAEIAVFARVSAAHKLQIVNAWKQRGDVVAMTGDGVNDAPAVKAADIGIAMGRTGADVTKDAADLVLVDDNFSTIVNAVEEGRGILDNIQKFVLFLLACNMGEVCFMLLAALLGWPVPLKPIQVLWINLVTDGLPAMALSFEPTEREVMRRPPRPPHTPVIQWSDGVRVLVHGGLIALVTLAVFYLARRNHSLEIAQTAAFSTMAMAQLFYALCCRSFGRIMPQLGWFTNPLLLGAIVASLVIQALAVTVPWFHPWLETHPLPVGTWWLVLGCALIPVTVVEVQKLLYHAFRRQSG